MEIVIQFFKYCFSFLFFVKLHRFSKPSFKRTFRPQRTPLVAAARTGARTLIPKVTPKDHPKLIVGVVDVGSSVGDRSTLLHPPSPGWQKKVTARLAPQHLCSGGFWTCPRLTLAPMSSCPRLSTNNLRQRKKKSSPANLPQDVSSTACRLVACARALFRFIQMSTLSARTMCAISIQINLRPSQIARPSWSLVALRSPHPS